MFPTKFLVQSDIMDREDMLFEEFQDDCHLEYQNRTILALKVPRKKMHLKMLSAEVVCCK